VNRIKTANELFNRGYNCAQALLASFGVDLGLNRDMALKIASPFGGGIGRMGEACGAVTGGLMIIGLKYGITEPGFEKKMKTYEVVSTFIEQFKKRNKSRSIFCSELIGFRMNQKKTLKQEEKDIIQTKCPRFVQDAAEIIEEILQR
jgi:C_GCAxxG_C_C family probable redox protein